MAYHRDPANDPYLKAGRAARGGADSDDESTGSEAEALRLKESDLLILAARNEDDCSYLEVGCEGGGCGPLCCPSAA